MIFLNTEEASDKIWHLSLLYESAKLHFPVSIMKLIYSSFSIIKWEVSTNCEVAVPREQRYHSVLLNSPFCTVCIQIMPPNSRHLYIHWVLSSFPLCKGCIQMMTPKHEEILQPPLLMILVHLPHCKQNYILKIIQCSLMSTELRCE